MGCMLVGLALIFVSISLKKCLLLVYFEVFERGNDDQEVTFYLK